MATDRDTAVRVPGLKRLRSDLRKLGDATDLADAHGRVAATVAAEGTVRAPVGPTGRLAETVRGTRVAGRAVVAAGGARTPYAGPVHWGWPAHNIEAQPFIADAAQATEDQWLPEYEAELVRLTAQAVAGTY